jgi:hypothetical protein
MNTRSLLKAVRWRTVALAALALLSGSAAWGGWWWHNRYWIADEMQIPIREYDAAGYPEDPGERSVHLCQYSGRTLKLVRRDSTHFDFVFVPLHEHVAQVTFKNVDVSLMTPGEPEWTKKDPHLERIALTDRQWNRQQVRFERNSPHLEVSGGNGFETDNLFTAELAKNCLNAGLWEVVLTVKENDRKAAYYHGWFTFPLGHYRDLFEHNTGLSYWDHWYKLEHWSDPAGIPVKLDGLRSAKFERRVDAEFRRDEPILYGGEQSRKKRTTIAKNLVAWRDFYDGPPVKFATFIPPGRYSVNHPWGNEYWRFARFERAILREIESPAQSAQLHELELVFRDGAGNASRFFVGGIDLKALPVLPRERYPDGLYMPMGIGVPPFFQSYAELAGHPPQRSPYYSVLLDESDRWINHHEAAVDGPVMHRDEHDPDLVHLYLLSYERHSLIVHVVISIAETAEQTGGAGG